MFNGEVSAKFIEKHGGNATGRKQLIKHLRGEKLRSYEAIAAFCYDCMAYCINHGSDCNVASCPLYCCSPYNPDSKFRSRADGENDAERRRRSDEHKKDKDMP